MAGVEFPAGGRNSSLIHSIKASYEAHPPSYPMHNMGFSQVVKWQGHEADHIHPQLYLYLTLPYPMDTEVGILLTCLLMGPTAKKFLNC
jgi:hypothetical protein